MPASLVDSALLDSEASVLATLDFLGQDGMEDEDNLRYMLLSTTSCMKVVLVEIEAVSRLLYMNG